MAARKSEVYSLKSDLQNKQNQLTKDTEQQYELKAKLNQVQTDTGSMETKSKQVRWAS